MRPLIAALILACLPGIADAQYVSRFSSVQTETTQVQVDPPPIVIPPVPVCTHFTPAFSYGAIGYGAGFSRFGAFGYGGFNRFGFGASPFVGFNGGFVGSRFGFVGGTRLGGHGFARARFRF